MRSSYQVTKEDLSVIQTVHSIISRNNSAEIKKKATGGLVVYEIKKEKRHG